MKKAVKDIFFLFPSGSDDKEFFIYLLLALAFVAEVLSFSLVVESRSFSLVAVCGLLLLGSSRACRLQ